MRTTSRRYSRSSRNRPAATSCRRSRLVAATMPHVDAPGDVLADAAQLAFLDDVAAPLACARGDSSPISSRNSVPPCASSNTPASLGNRAGERAARVSEQLGLDELVGQRRAVERAEGAVAPRAAAMHARARPAPCRCRSPLRSAPETAPPPPARLAPAPRRWHRSHPTNRRMPAGTARRHGRLRRRLEPASPHPS